MHAMHERGTVCPSHAGVGEAIPVLAVAGSPCASTGKRCGLALVGRTGFDLGSAGESFWRTRRVGCVAGASAASVVLARFSWPRVRDMPERRLVREDWKATL